MEAKTSEDGSNSGKKNSPDRHFQLDGRKSKIVHLFRAQIFNS
jgi:hypothetical protein